MANFISWQQFGLKKDPYDTLPLVEGGDLPIEQAFVGREADRIFVDNLLAAEDRLCLTVCGDTGVGKTSLINFQKFIWKYEKMKLLFSTRREIEASSRLLNKENFIIEIIGSVLQEIKLRDEHLLKSEPLQTMVRLVDITQTLELSFGASVLGYGGSLAGGRDVAYPMQVPISVLEQYFYSLIEFITQNEVGGYKYSGLLIQVNNFDVVMDTQDMSSTVIRFFNEIRDLLQISRVYFVFLGPKNFYKDIIATQKRVKSIFYQTPLQIKPLTKTEIVQAFDKRMQLLQSEGVSTFTKPVEDAVISQLYDLYAGDIRAIMGAVRDIIGQLDSSGRPLKVDEAMILLGRFRWEEINNALSLTDGQIEMLNAIIESGNYLSQKQAALKFNKSESNVSGYYFKPLKENDIIEKKGAEGKEIFYGLTPKYTPLREFVASQKKLREEVIRQQQEQMNLFNRRV